ncbi:MAG: glycosyltransferase [Candidatus Nanopelagicales bacterium]
MPEPFVSVVTPVYRPNPEHLRAFVASVRDQTLQEWHLVLVDDGSGAAEVSAILSEADTDPRVTVVVRPVNGGIVAATNDGLAAATGDYVAFADQDDVLAPHALETMVTAARASPTAELLYSDEDKVDDHGEFSDEFRKPDYSPERLRGNMYMGHLLMARREAVVALGGMREGFDGSQDHDLALRLSERGAPVIHVPEVLYHWRRHAGSTAEVAGGKPEAVRAGVRAVQDHVDRLDLHASVSATDYPGFYRLDRHPKAGSMVSIVIPTRGGSGDAFDRRRCFVVEAVRSIEAHSYEVDYEYVIVADAPTRWVDVSYLDDLAGIAGQRLRVVEYRGDFNFSEKVNLGALHARGDLLCFLNDDVEVISPRWLDTLAAIAQQPDVGAVGCLLRFEDGTLQHAGHLYGKGEATHAYFESGDRTGYFGDLLLDRETIGVTAACLMQRRDVWWEVGGFTETLPVSFNDVDFCLKIQEAGYRVVTAASVELLHFESRTRSRRVRAWEPTRLRARWRHRLEHDPYSPYLSERIGT